MKKLYLFLSFAFAFAVIRNTAFAQTPFWQWAVGNQPAGRFNENVATDKAGNVYTAGKFLNKYDPNGNQLWSHDLFGQIGAIGRAYVSDLAGDSAGNTIITGHFVGTIQLDTISLKAFALEDIFIAKFDAHGAIQWARRAGGIIPKLRGPGCCPIEDESYGLSQDPFGISYVLGSSETNPGDTLRFDNYDFVASSFASSYIAKYNAAGSIQWVRDVSDTLKVVRSIAASPDGGYFLTGMANYYWTPGSAGRIFVEKYDAAGVLEWQNWGIAVNMIYVSTVYSDRNGNSYITGRFESNTTFGSTLLQVPPNSYGHMYLVKYNPAGQLQWARQTTGAGSGQSSASSSGNAIAVDSLSNVYVTGGFTNNLSFSGSVQLVASSILSEDIFAAKYDASGNILWAVKAGGTGVDYGTGISARNNGDYFVTGSSGAAGSTFGNISLSNSLGSSSFFLAKLSTNPLGVAKTAGAANFQLYPNPSASEVTIAAAEIRQGTVTVFNLTGQKIYEAQLLPEMKLNVARWPAGIYAVKLTSGSKTLTRKLVVTH